MFLREEPFAPHSCRDAIKRGVGYVPRDREEEGLILTASVGDNITLPMLDRFSHFAFLARHTLTRMAREAIRQARIKAESPGVIAGHLSGGNRQKVVISRWMIQPFEVLVLDNPTRGVDVGAKAEIHDRLEEMRQRDGTILIVSAEMPELRRLCDRILIMRRGELVREFPTGVTEEQLITSMV
jgi:ribose transport system ATP-binding protein